MSSYHILEMVPAIWLPGSRLVVCQCANRIHSWLYSFMLEQIFILSCLSVEVGTFGDVGSRKWLEFLPYPLMCFH